MPILVTNYMPKQGISYVVNGRLKAYADTMSTGVPSFSIFIMIMPTIVPNFSILRLLCFMQFNTTNAYTKSMRLLFLNLNVVKLSYLED